MTEHRSSSSRIPPEDGSPARVAVRLGHDLRNSTTILMGILDRLEELKRQHPQLGELAADLDHTVDQIQAVAQRLSALGHDIEGRSQGEAK